MDGIVLVVISWLQRLTAAGQMMLLLSVCTWVCVEGVL